MHLNAAIASTVSLTFVALAVWHLWMALSPKFNAAAAIPSLAGRPPAVPSAIAFVGVAVVLLAFAGLVAATGGIVQVGLPARYLSWLSFALSLGLLARAIGEFKYVGFFKRVRGTRFARLDTLVYSPLCLLLAAGVALVAKNNGS
jgi:Protein of unknown function (DUF3995)